MRKDKKERKLNTTLWEYLTNKFRSILNTQKSLIKSMYKYKRIATNILRITVIPTVETLKERTCRNFTLSLNFFNVSWFLFRQGC